MIRIENGKHFDLVNPNGDTKAIDKAIEDVSTIIRGASPFLEKVRIFNKTKGCHVDVCFNRGEVVILVTNPDDERFRLEDVYNTDGELAHEAPQAPLPR